MWFWRLVIITKLWFMAMRAVMSTSRRFIHCWVTTICSFSSKWGVSLTGKIPTETRHSIMPNSTRIRPLSSSYSGNLSVKNHRKKVSFNNRSGNHAKTPRIHYNNKEVSFSNLNCLTNKTGVGENAVCDEGRWPTRTCEKDPCTLHIAAVIPVLFFVFHMDSHLIWKLH